jgi:hypothetical protein
LTRPLSVTSYGIGWSSLVMFALLKCKMGAP